VSEVNPPRTARALGVLALASAMAASAGAALWVSPAGDDRGPGTEEQPLRTIERARDIVRTQNHDMADDITVFLAGEFRITRPIEFESQDSGTNGFNIVYTAAPGEHPVLSGGVRIGGWAVADKARNLWSAPAPEGLAYAHNLFVNGSPAGRTRSRMLEVFAKDSSAAASPDPTAQWKNPDDVVFEPAGDGAVWSERTGTMPVFVENTFELLGTPGEWYFDRPARRVYYTPRAGEDMASADIEAPVPESLVIGLGTLDRPITGLVFKGIRFEYTAWHRSSDDEPAWGAVSFNYAGGIQFLEDEFLHMSTPALELGPHVANGAVEACLFGDIAWSAIRVAQASGIRIAQSRFSYVATRHIAEGAIDVARSLDVSIEHNQIENFPTVGVRVHDGAKGAVSEASNRISEPMIGLHGSSPAPAAPQEDAGVSPYYRALLERRFSAPTAPMPPAGVSAEPEDEFAYVTWTPNCQDGGSPVTGYVVATSGGDKVAVTRRDFEEKGYVVVGGLENGRAVSFTVAAVSGLGASPPSLPTASVKPLKKRKLKAPAPPAAVSISAGRPPTVQITPPLRDGGSPVVAYALAAGPGSAPIRIEGLDVVHADASHPVNRAVWGLPAEAGAQVSVSATNAAGEGKPAVVVVPR